SLCYTVLSMYLSFRLPFILTTFNPAGSVSGYHRFEFSPAAPQRYPAGKAVSFAILMATEASHVHVELQHRRIPFQPAWITAGQSFHVDAVDHVGGRPTVGVRGAGGVTQAQQRGGYGRDQGNGRLQAFDLLELQRFDAAAGLHAFVKFLSVPIIIPPKITLLLGCHYHCVAGASSILGFGVISG